MIQFFHWYTPGDSFLWKHTAEQAAYLKKLGITSAWLPPAYKATQGNTTPGYDTYDLYDLGEFDQKGSIPTKYGTKDHLLHACQELKAHGIGVIADVVLNHKGGADDLETVTAVKVDPNNRQIVISEPHEIQAYTVFTFPGRGDQYSEFQWDSTCFSGVDYAHGIEGYAIYRINNGFGDHWERMITDERGNYDYLMFADIDTRNPHVKAELDHWGHWLHEQIDFHGVRLDAVKHMCADFYTDWIQNLRTNTGKNIFAVGEYWAPSNLDLLKRYIAATEESMSLFDAPLHHNFHHASKAGEHYDLRKILDHSLMTAHPELAVTLVGNHDTQPLQALEAPVKPWFKPLAYALILLRTEGLPCVFYPDLYGATYTDKGRDGNLHTVTISPVACLETLIQLRKTHAYGEQYVYHNDPHCIGFTRLGNHEHEGCAVIMSNKGANAQHMEIGSRYAGKTFHDALSHHPETITIDPNGWAKFPCPAGSVSVWIAST